VISALELHKKVNAKKIPRLFSYSASPVKFSDVTAIGFVTAPAAKFHSVCSLVSCDLRILPFGDRLSSTGNGFDSLSASEMPSYEF
jgi:hypothetical protein